MRSLRREVRAPGGPREWVPMRPYRGRRRFEIADPLVEPLWSGVRVLAHVDPAAPDGAPRVALLEDEGADLAPELPALAAAVGMALQARDAVLDGVISPQVALESSGSAPVAEVRASSTSVLVRKVELEVMPRGRRGLPEDAPEGFIAFDLLRLDGHVLLDVPLLERKRLLESVLDASDLVRRSVHVRPPIDTWIGTWRSMGLRGGILKAANSRYRPGSDTTEWRLVESVHRRA